MNGIAFPPWWARILSKLVLARLPVGYGVWRRLGLFRHGDMDRPDAAIEKLLRHARYGGVLSPEGTVPRFRAAAEGREYGVLELGPGDSVYSAYVARALGASRTWLIDAGAFARRDAAAVARVIERLAARGMPLENVAADAPLEAVGASYLTEGLDSLRTIPDESVDYVFSNSVLEHVSLAQFPALAQELARITRPGGLAVHHIDLKDHLGGSLNNLRFGERLWESALFTRSGFYTNRLRRDALLELLAVGGFALERAEYRRWDRLPIAREVLAPAWRESPDEELCVSAMHVALRKT